MGGIDQDPQEQYDEWMDEADQRTNAHFRMITSLNQADDGLSPTVPANSTDLARVKSDEEPAVKPRRKEKADMARVSNPWSDTDCTAVKEGRNGWDQVTKTAFVAALLNARPASEKEVFTRYASISTTSFKVGLPKKLWNQAAYYEFARYICSEYPVRRACCACYNSWHGDNRVRVGYVRLWSEIRAQTAVYE
jgi:hypothetical protein